MPLIRLPNGSVIYQPDAQEELEAFVYGLEDDVTDKVPNTRLITAGSGLLGGGNLTADRSLSVDTSVISTRAYADSVAGVPPSRTITAGAGLTGGGDLSANRSLAADTTVLATRTYAETLAAGTPSTDPIFPRAKLATGADAAGWVISGVVWQCASYELDFPVTFNRLHFRTAGTPTDGSVIRFMIMQAPNGRYNDVQTVLGDVNYTQVGTVPGAATVTFSNITLAKGDFWLCFIRVSGAVTIINRASLAVTNATQNLPSGFAPLIGSLATGTYTSVDPKVSMVAQTSAYTLAAGLSYVP